MAPNIESLTPEQLDAMEQAAIAQASAPAASMDLSKMSPEELDALEQQHLPQEPMEETEANTPWNRFAGTVPDIASGMKGIVERSEGDPNAKDFFPRHPGVQQIAKLALKDIPTGAATAMGLAASPVIGPAGAIMAGTGASLLGQGAYENADKFLNKLSDGDISGAFSNPDTSWLPQNVAQETLAGVGNATAQVALTKLVESVAKSAVVDKVSKNLDDAKSWFNQAVGATSKQGDEFARYPAGDVAAKAFEDGYLLSSPRETSKAVAKAVGYTNKVDDYTVQGELGQKINDAAKTIYQQTKAESPFSAVKARIFGDPKNGIPGDVVRLIKSSQGTNSADEVIAGLAGELDGVLQDARSLIPVNTPAGTSNLREVYEGLQAAKEAVEGKLSGLDSLKMTATTRATQRATLEKELGEILDGVDDLAKGTHMPGMKELQALYDDPPISLPDLINFKRNVANQLGNTDFAKGLAQNAPWRKEAIQAVRGALADESSDLALRAGGQLGKELADANAKYHNLSYFKEYLPAISQEEIKSKLGTTTGEKLRDLGADVIDVVRHPASAIGKAAQPILGTKHTSLSDWDKAFDRFTRAKTMGNAVGLGQEIAAGGRAIDNLPIVPKFIGLQTVTGLGRKVLTPEDANASEVEGLTNAIAASMLPPEQLQDPAATQQALAQAQQVLQPLNMAMTHGTREDVAAEMSLLTKEHPEVFAAPKTGIPGEVVVEGKVMFPHPEDGMKYSERVKRADLGTVEKSKIRSDVHWKGLVSKVIK